MTENAISATDATLDLYLHGATLLIGDGTPAIRNGAIGIAGDRIAFVGPAPAKTRAAKRVIAASGRVVVPGFVNVPRARARHDRRRQEGRPDDLRLPARPHPTPAVALLRNLVHTAHGRDVESVIVDGEIVVEGGRPTRVDVERVCAEAERAAKRLWSDGGRA